jgi:transcriptional regulator with XRE-family HTH domain
VSIHKLDNYLRTYRKRSGLSQDELAYLLGTGDGAKVSRYEKNGRQPTLDTVLAYEAIFRVASRELFAGRFQRADRSVTRRARLLAERLAREPQDYRVARKLEALAAIRGSNATSSQVS